MSSAKENANPLQNRYYEARSGSGAHWTRARVRVSFPNAHVSRFSLASPVKREKITPVLQAKNHPRRHRGLRGWLTMEDMEQHVHGTPTDHKSLMPH